MAPAPLIVPVLLLPLLTPSTVQVTSVFDVFWTVAVNCCAALVARLTAGGLMLMRTTGARLTVTAALANLLASARLVTVTVCEPALDGAV